MITKFNTSGFRGLLMVALLGSLVSCGTTKKESLSPWAAQHVEFRQGEGWKKQVFVNPPVYDQVTTERSSVKISLAEQRGYLLLDGKHVAMDFPVATGKKDYRTPTGTYTVLQRKEEYSSNLYGRFVDIESGKTIDRDADSRKPTPEGAKFVGASMPNWMRLTNTGVGLHIGYVPGYPASHGCIRVVRSAMNKLYPVSKIGTPVEVAESWQPAELRAIAEEEEG